MLTDTKSTYNVVAKHADEQFVRRHHVIHSYKARADAKRSGAEKFADSITNALGSVFFLGLNGMWFLLWITINTGLIPWVPAFDPFPFGLLTMIVSLEAIFLAIIVLISQNRAARVDEMREEVDLQVNMIAEEEVTKALQLLTLVLRNQGTDVANDSNLQAMLKPIQSLQLEQRLEKQLDPATEESKR
jgi:uncharacterized membrane protein